jgi:hypothetical protein
MLAQDDEDPGADHDRRSGEHGPCRNIAEDEVADEDAEDDRGVFERGDRGDVGVAVALGEQDLAEPAAEARPAPSAPSVGQSGTIHPNGSVASESTVAVSEK